MKVGDLVRYRHTETDIQKAIGIVVGTTNHAKLFDILELCGPFVGQYTNGSAEDWKVISERR